MVDFCGPGLCGKQAQHHCPYRNWGQVRLHERRVISKLTDLRHFFTTSSSGKQVALSTDSGATWSEDLGAADNVNGQSHQSTGGQSLTINCYRWKSSYFGRRGHCALAYQLQWRSGLPKLCSICYSLLPSVFCSNRLGQEEQLRVLWSIWVVILCLH